MTEELAEPIREVPSIRPPEKRLNLKLIGLILGLLLLFASIPAVVYLFKQREKIREMFLPSPTPTPSLLLECKKLKAYDENWEEISDLSLVSPGDKVYFSVEGLCDEPQGITQARLRVNEGEWLEPTGQKEGDFYFEYEITSEGHYKVEAMVYNPTIGWR